MIDNVCKTLIMQMMADIKDESVNDFREVVKESLKAEVALMDRKK